MNEKLKSKLCFSGSMFVFGTIGIFRRYLPFPSGTIAFFRGITGALFLLVLMLLKKQKRDREALRKNALFLCLSGAFIGANWILLFEAYNYTTVATATLCYYMAPIIVLILSPFVLREKLTLKNGICVFTSLIGMLLVSGVTSQGRGESTSVKGILLGLGAAVLYAGVIMLNRKIHDIGAYDKTIVQLAAASAVILPYTLIAERVNTADINLKTVAVLLAVGIVHTGISYAVYFGSMDNMSAQSIALLSYIDPVVALLLSALILRESMGVPQIIGAVLILGSTVSGELDFKNKVTT